MRPRDHAQALLRKAAQDEFTVKKLIGDPASPDEVIGFHAQQTIEKMLKARLALASIPYRRTHDLVELLDLLREHSIPVPEELEEVRRLTPFAVAFRYEDVSGEPEEPFDRDWALGCLKTVKSWIEDVLRTQKGND